MARGEGKGGVPVCCIATTAVSACCALLCLCRWSSLLNDGYGQAQGVARARSRSQRAAAEPQRGYAPPVVYGSTEGAGAGKPPVAPPSYGAAARVQPGADG